MAVTNRELFAEITQVKVILVGDGTPESMENSIQYRLTRVEKTVKPNGTRESDGNGGYLERRKPEPKKTWRQQFKEMPFSGKLKVLMWGIPLIIIYWEWIFAKIYAFLNFIESLLK